MAASPNEHQVAFRRGAYGVLCLSIGLGPIAWLIACLLVGVVTESAAADVPAPSFWMGWAVAIGAPMAFFALMESTVRRHWEARVVGAFYLVVLVPRSVVALAGSAEAVVLVDLVVFLLAVASVAVFIVSQARRMPSN